MLSQLARIHLLLGDLDVAGRYAHVAREIRESLSLKEAHFDYDTFSVIAGARGDTPAAAEWARKRDDLRAELERRAGGGSSLPGQMLRALQQLAIACARAGFGGEPLDPDAEEAVAKLDGHPAPFPTFATALRELAEGRLPLVPTSLTKELQEVLEGIIKAIHDSPHG